MEAGLQYDARPGNINEAPGWFLFERVTNYKYKGYWIFDTDRVASRGSLGNITMSLSLLSDGQVGVSLDKITGTASQMAQGQNMFKQPYWPDLSNTTLQNKVIARRVVGVTQQTTKMNGAYLHGGRFSGGSIAQVWNDPNRNILVTNSFVPWTTGDLASIRNYGPFTPIGNPSDPGFQTKPDPVWAIDFANPFQRLRDNNGSDPSDAIVAQRKEGAKVTDRFSNETVNINMIPPPGSWKYSSKTKGKSHK